MLPACERSHLTKRFNGRCLNFGPIF
jgi:hypothetical protein